MPPNNGVFIPAKPTKKSPRKAAKPAVKKTASKPKAAPRKRLTPAAERRTIIVKALDAMKAENIEAIDIADKCSFADFMVVATGRSQRHVASLADDVVRALRGNGMNVMSVEGQQTGDWVLIDAGDVVVHIFRPETRQFYNIEKMWAVAPSGR